MAGQASLGRHALEIAGGFFPEHLGAFGNGRAQGFLALFGGLGQAVQAFGHGLGQGVEARGKGVELFCLPFGLGVHLGVHGLGQVPHRLQDFLAQVRGRLAHAAKKGKK